MQCGFKTPWHPSHTTGSYGNTGISGIDLPGVTSAPVGKTIRVASIREHGQALKDIRTPSRFSYAAKSISIPFSTTPVTSFNSRCFMYASSHLAFLLSRRSLPRKVRVMNFKRGGDPFNPIRILFRKESLLLVYVLSRIASRPKR